MKILITGGAGFIGSAVARFIIQNTSDEVINVDKLTYAGNLDNLDDIFSSDRHIFEQVDICDIDKITQIFVRHQPDVVMHLAAESHVDRSIDNPMQFIQTNFVGTYNLLEVSYSYWCQLSDSKKKIFRFHHISTDEVFGDLDQNEQPFTERSPYKPSSPYSATKAGSDHLVRAWGRTYELPVVITNCSNNYGPYQFPEKLIPLTVINALSGKNIPVYGDGLQIRDWLYVEDHAEALHNVITHSDQGQTYNIGGNDEIKNIDVVHRICDILEKLHPITNGTFSTYRDLVTFVDDRPGHDKRYAIDSTKISSELDWRPKETFDTGILKTIKWFIDNKNWTDRVLSGAYLDNQNKGNS